MRGLSIFVLLTGLLLASQVWARATIESVSGDVKIGLLDAKQGNVVLPGQTVKTGPGGRAVLMFPDKQKVTLNENTRYKIERYSYRPEAPSESISVTRLFKGSLRFVSGLIGKKNRKAVKIQAPTATIGIRGTEFILVSYNPVFVQGLSGITTMTGATGQTLAIGAGQFGTVSGVGAAASSIAASQLPAAAAGQMGALGGGVGGASAGGAAGSGTGGAGGAGAGGGAGGGAGAGAGGAAGGAGAGAGAAGGAAGAAGAGAGISGAALGAGAAAVGAAVGLATTEGATSTSTSTATSTQ